MHVFFAPEGCARRRKKLGVALTTTCTGSPHSAYTKRHKEADRAYFACTVTCARGPTRTYLFKRSVRHYAIAAIATTA